MVNNKHFYITVEQLADAPRTDVYWLLITDLVVCVGEMGEAEFNRLRKWPKYNLKVM